MDLKYCPYVLAKPLVIRPSFFLFVQRTAMNYLYCVSVVTNQCWPTRTFTYGPVSCAYMPL